ncbi:hypothetical protein SLEP1_g8841 [Rubroshorea leprosula]|uniref:Pectinesterase inhibitor domain-containing protein n=1 Tax=Rubroshorea leprosula TaxID=152421 RepID=A0AAV5IE52_9ROSI|nr:hypothetical protein SLEP1_g8841 [Rubroshorea leprosula]
MKIPSFVHTITPVVLFILLQFFTYMASTSATSPFQTRKDIDYIKISCNTTSYPRLCYRSLSIYASEINSSPKLLANTALNVTLRAAKSTSRLMTRISRIPGLRRREAVALADCMEVIGDSVEEIQQSIEELGHINRYNFDITMSDIQTWVSAALTDEDTCMEGFDGTAMDGKVKGMVRRRIVKIAHLTSNALAIVNDYASTPTNMP